jgi:hypothetical protein
MLFERGNGAFSRVNTVVVQRDKLYIHFVGADIFFGGLGTLVVHHVQCGLVVAHAEDGKYPREGGDEQGVGAAWHGLHDKGVDVVDVCHKNILHIYKRLDRESTREVGVHGPCGCVCKGSEQNMSCIVQASCVGDI